LDHAFVPQLPVQPNQRRIMILALIVGCVLGLGVAMMRDQLNPQFRRAEEVEQLFGPQLLAIIPDFSFEYDRVSWYNRIGWKRSPPSDRIVDAFGQGIDASEPRTSASKGLLDQQRDGQSFQDSFVVKWLPNSTAAEQYRVAATRLLLARTNGQSTIVAVTSAIKSEGKTTTVINLGYTMARDLGKRTLILDCDFKCPMLHHYAETVPKWGLADCLIGDIPLDDCLFGFEDASCWIMPVGSSDVHPTELLKNQRLAGILAQLRARFDYIFINTPPIFPLAAMNILARHADILLLVVRADSTPKHVVQRALSSLPSTVPAHVILNAVRHQALPSYMGAYGYLAKQSS
jgi:capsular exopolysaccharide synthesis family protein